MSWRRIKETIAASAQRLGSRLSRGLQWLSGKVLEGLRWLGIQLHLIPPPAPPMTTIATSTAVQSALAAVDTPPHKVPSSELCQTLTSEKPNSNPASSEFKTQIIRQPENSEKKITATRALLLKSDRVLLQHQTCSESALELFDLTREEKLFFSVYDRKLQKNQLLAGEYKCHDLPRCYLPTGPVLSPLQDEICFLDKEDEFRGLAITQGDSFITDNYLCRSNLFILACTSLGSQEYVFVRKPSVMGPNNMLVHCRQEQGNIRILNTYQSSREIFHSVTALTPNLLCAATFTDLDLFQLEEKSGFTLKNSFRIDHIDGKKFYLYCFTVVGAISDHEIIAFAFGHSKPCLGIQIFLKIDLESKQVHECKYPGIMLGNTHTLSLSPPLYFAENRVHQLRFVLDPQEMALVSLQIPAFYKLQGVMPDGSLLLKTPHKSEEHILFTDPAIQRIFSLKQEIINNALQPFLPSALTSLVSDYVGNDASIKLSTHYASFYAGSNRGELKSIELEEVKPSFFSRLLKNNSMH